MIKFFKDGIKYVDWTVYIGLFILLYSSSLFDGNYFNLSFIISYILIIPLIIIVGKVESKYRVYEKDNSREKRKNIK